MSWIGHALNQKFLNIFDCSNSFIDTLVFKLKSTVMLTSIIKGKCPRCRKGNLFVNSNPYYLKQISEMHKQCSCCGQVTEPEPGFYFGAMYVSYAFGVGIFVMNFILFALLFPIPSLAFIILNTAVLLLLWPVFFRLARMVYLNFFVKFDPEVAKNTTC